MAHMHAWCVLTVFLSDLLCPHWALRLGDNDLSGTPTDALTDASTLVGIELLMFSNVLSDGSHSLILSLICLILLSV